MKHSIIGQSDERTNSLLAIIKKLSSILFEISKTG